MTTALLCAAVLGQQMMFGPKSADGKFTTLVLIEAPSKKHVTVKLTDRNGKVRTDVMPGIKPTTMMVPLGVGPQAVMVLTRDLDGKRYRFNLYEPAKPGKPVLSEVAMIGNGEAAPTLGLSPLTWLGWTDPKGREWMATYSSNSGRWTKFEPERS